MLTAEKNRRANSPKVIHKGLDEHIRWLEKRLSGLDHELAGLVRETPIWRERDELLRSVPGGRKGALDHPVARLPELGALNRKQIAALVGLAPFNRTAVACAAAVVSGVVAPRSGASCIWPWSPRFVPIQSSRTFTSNLRARGKYPKSALTACMRKLLVILNAMLRSKISWQTSALASSTATLSPLLGAVPEHGCC
jgi:transposase